MKLFGLFMCLVLVGVAGCSDFLGLEDYQRDILSVLIARVGQEAASDGLNCWDKDGDSMCDEAEDWNSPEGGSDGVCDAWDCQGAPSGGDNCTTLCHRHGGDYSTLVVPAPAVQSHLNHGDTCGPCEK